MADVWVTTNAANPGPPKGQPGPGPWDAQNSNTNTSPPTRANATTNAVSEMPASILASTTRIRRGSRANVVIPVRWLHSLETSMTPRIGSRNDETKADAATNDP